MKIHLDHAKHPDTAPPWTLGLLMGAVVLVSVAGWEYVTLDGERTHLRSQMVDEGEAGRYAFRPVPSPETQKNLREQVLQANAVLGELGRPWPALFLLLEEVAQPEIALLAIRPDTANGRLRIAGEAREMTDALNYVRKLSTSRLVKDVVLEEHEVLVSDQLKPVRFALSARWVS